MGTWQGIFTGIRWSNIIQLPVTSCLLPGLTDNEIFGLLIFLSFLKLKSEV